MTNSNVDEKSLILFNDETWEIEDQRLMRYRRADRISAYFSLFEHGCAYAIDTIHCLSHYWKQSGTHLPIPFALPTKQPCYSRHCNFENIHPKGLMVFLHGLRSSSWQWRHVVPWFMNAPEFSEYKFWVPEIECKGNCDLLSAIEPLQPVISEFAQKNPNGFIYLIGTSNGARIAAMLETQLNVELFWKIRLRVVSIAGFFGTSNLAKYLDCVGLLKPLCYSPCVREALVEDSPHQELLDSWNERQRVWKENDVDVKHKFYSSIDDERLYPVISSFPKLDYTNPEDFVLVNGWDHSGIVTGIKNRYLSWCKSESVEKHGKKKIIFSTMYYILAECHMALDQLSEMQETSRREKEHCNLCKKYISENEQNLQWCKDFVLSQLGHGSCLGELLYRALAFSGTGDKRAESLRDALMEDIREWLPAPC